MTDEEILDCLRSLIHNRRDFVGRYPVERFAEALGCADLRVVNIAMVSRGPCSIDQNGCLWTLFTGACLIERVKRLLTELNAVCLESERFFKLAERVIVEVELERA